MGRTPRVHLAVTCALAVVLAACGGGGDDDATPGSTTSVPALASGTVEVLTYNVAGLPQEVSGENPEVNIPKISPLLAPYDLVLTQEDFDWWLPGGLAAGLDFVNYHERLLAEADQAHSLDRHPGHEAVGISLEDRPDLNIGDGIGIASRFELADQERVPWEGCFGGFDTSDRGAADCLAMKGFAVATITLGGVEVDVYSLHAEAGSSEEDQRLQTADYEQLAAFIAERSAGRPIILGGDTNLHIVDDEDAAADGPIWSAFLEAAGLVDACDVTSCSDPGIIDKVAVRGTDELELTVEAHEIPREAFVDEAGEPLSDHSPVHVTVGWATR